MSDETPRPKSSGDERVEEEQRTADEEKRVPEEHVETDEASLQQAVAFALTHGPEVPLLPPPPPPDMLAFPSPPPDDAEGGPLDPKRDDMPTALASGQQQGVQPERKEKERKKTLKQEQEEQGLPPERKEQEQKKTEKEEQREFVSSYDESRRRDSSARRFSVAPIEEKRPAFTGTITPERRRQLEESNKAQLKKVPQGGKVQFDLQRLPNGEVLLVIGDADLGWLGPREVVGYLEKTSKGKKFSRGSITVHLHPGSGFVEGDVRKLLGFTKKDVSVSSAPPATLDDAWQSTEYRRKVIKFFNANYIGESVNWIQTCDEFLGTATQFSEGGAQPERSGGKADREVTKEQKSLDAARAERAAASIFEFCSNKDVDINLPYEVRKAILDSLQSGDMEKFIEAVKAGRNEIWKLLQENYRVTFHLNTEEGWLK
ncbi:hypothetical protein [Streptomyces sp. NPDC048419]|uniref:hypothetical protein n=1 Tax=Streptomyces sp. NPDC048419 TaxID=3365547 RepID=UPI00371C3575